MTPFIDGFLSSLVMIIVTELGDKTFFIAAIMAMRYLRSTVFAGAISALSVMTVLSAALGYLVPSVLPVKYTQFLAFILFVYFGFKLLREAWITEPCDADEDPEGMKEAAAELSKRKDVEDPEGMLADGTSCKGNPGGGSGMGRITPMLSAFFSPIFMQAFSLTFVAEWGDRSQIATIAMAAAKNPYAVTLGGIVGHSLCTGFAVFAGRLLAQRISLKTVNYLGGLLFLAFACATALGLKNN